MDLQLQKQHSSLLIKNHKPKNAQVFERYPTQNLREAELPQAIGINTYRQQHRKYSQIDFKWSNKIPNKDNAVYNKTTLKLHCRHRSMLLKVIIYGKFSKPIEAMILVQPHKDLRISFQEAALHFGSLIYFYLASSSISLRLRQSFGGKQNCEDLKLFKPLIHQHVIYVTA